MQRPDLHNSLHHWGLNGHQSFRDITKQDFIFVDEIEKKKLAHGPSPAGASIYAVSRASLNFYETQICVLDTSFKACHLEFF